VAAGGEGRAPVNTETLSVGRRIVAGVLLVLPGLFALVVGVRDSVFATELSSRGLGFVLAVAGALLVASAFPLRRNELKGAYALCLVASASGTFLWAFLALVQLATGDFIRTLWLWPVLAAASVGAGWLVRRAGWSSLGKVRANLVKAVGSIVSLGAVVALVQFAYTSLYVPSTAPPTLSLDLAMVRSGPGLEPSITVRNTGSTSVTILGSLYYVAVSKVADEAAKPADFNKRLADPSLADQAFGGPITEGYGKLRKAIVAEAGTLLPQEARLEAGEQTSRRFVVQLPRRSRIPREAKLLVFIRFVRASAIRLKGSPREVTRQSREAEDNGYVTQAELVESSWIRALVRDRRYLEREWEVTRAGSPKLAAAIDRGSVPDPSRDQDTRTRMESVYGFGSAGSTFELALDNRSR
jgi:hypothetical protein